jgi:hypothetical protein
MSGIFHQALLFNSRFFFLSSILTLFLAAVFCSAAGAADAASLSVSDSGGWRIIENGRLGVRLEVNLKNGVYRVSRNGEQWLGDGLVAMGLKGGLLLNAGPDGAPSDEMRITGTSESEGADTSGAYRALALKWEAPGLRFETEFRVYADVPQVKFIHRFPDGWRAEKTSKFEDTALNFPVFAAGGAAKDTHLFSYGFYIWPYPMFGKNPVVALSKWGAGTICEPLFAFDEQGRTGALAPFDDFMVRLVRVIDLSALGFGFGVAAGLNGELERLEPGHSSATILVFNDGGVRAAMYSLGAELMKASGKRPVGVNETPFLKYLGYWTDNGAYYYYRTEPDKNYETTLLDVNDYLKRESIPARYFQLDSWWYPKSKADDGVIEWTPMKELFPGGLEPFQQKLGLPLTFHNRFFSKENVYRKTMEFVDGSGGAHPAGREVFDLWAADVKRWGGIMYEQDWLGTQMGKIEKLRSDPAFADGWLSNMAAAMADRGLEIQYCMPTMAFYLESTRFQNVTNIRSSNDYYVRVSGQSPRLWWEHVYTSPMIAGLGAIPFKDVIVTTPPPKKSANAVTERFYTGTGNDKYDPNGELYEPFYHHSALLSILSAGPTGIGDRIGSVNKPVVMLMADEDGALVKPDRPFAPIDRLFYEDPYTEPVALTAYTLSEVSGRTWFYVVGMNAEQAISKVKFTLGAADIGLQGKYVVYDFFSGTAMAAAADFSIRRKLAPSDIAYLVFAPLSAQGRALVGDVGKYVTASAGRIRSWTDSEAGMTIELDGPKGSPTRLLVYSPAAPSRVRSETRNITIQKIASGGAPASDTWAPAGKNLYLVSIPGGAGEKIGIEF